MNSREKKIPLSQEEIELLIMIILRAKFSESGYETLLHSDAAFLLLSKLFDVLLKKFESDGYVASLLGREIHRPYGEEFDRIYEALHAAGVSYDDKETMERAFYPYKMCD